MSMSGIAADAECAVAYNDMKLRQTDRFLLFKVSDDKKRIVLDQRGPADATFEDFANKMAEIGGEKDCRYALYDFHIEAPERTIKKIAFIFWCPDDALIGKKMIYSSSKETLKKSFAGQNLEFQCNALSDIDFESMKAEVIRKS